MATQSEDVIPRASMTSGDADSEGEEETTADYPNFPTTTPGLPALNPFSLPSDPKDVPDYMAGLPTSFKSTGSALPKRGLKDFEPHPTQLQASTLETSRLSMNSALQHMRVHGPKTRVIGVFDERTGLTTVKRRRGNWLGNVGRDIAGGGVVLRREEALWAIERGSLDCRYRIGAFADGENQQSEHRRLSAHLECDTDQADSPKQLKEGDDEENGLPMSLQTAYAALMDDRRTAPGGALTMEEYVVYGGLKRSGFIVLRAKDTDRWKTALREMDGLDGRWVPKDVMSLNSSKQPTLWSWLYELIFISNDRSVTESSSPRTSSLIQPGLHRSYQDVFRLITQSTLAHWAPVALEQTQPEPQQSSAYTTTWHVYKPSAARPFKKKEPGQPDFCICVVNAGKTRLPTLIELDALMNEQSLDKLSGSTIEDKNKRGMGQMYAALKRGHRHVLLAIVDEGIVSYMRVADAVFAQEGRLFDREGFGTVGGPGSKKSGGGERGRHRGRKS